jgi:hypothetical protein
MRDDFDPGVADRFKVLDDVPVPDTWSRVLDRVPSPDPWSPVPFATEMVTLIDLEPPVPSEPRRKGPMRVLVAGLLAAAAVVAAIVVVARRDDAVNPADGSAPSVNVPPTTPPRALFDTEGNRLEPGTYFVDEVDGTPTARIFVTIGAGWDYSETHNGDAWTLGMPGEHGPGDGSGFIAFSRPARVFSDACHWGDGYHPGPVTTLDGLVAALTAQGGWAEVTAPSDISIDGYPGKTFQRTAPGEFSDCGTGPFRPRLPTQESGVAFRSWENETDTSFGGNWYEPDQVETLLVLDIDGTVVVINTRPFPEASAADRADFAAVLDSIRIERE